MPELQDKYILFEYGHKNSEAINAPKICSKTKKKHFKYELLGSSAYSVFVLGHVVLMVLIGLELGVCLLIQ